MTISHCFWFAEIFHMNGSGKICLCVLLLLLVLLRLRHSPEGKIIRITDSRNAKVN